MFIAVLFTVAKRWKDIPLYLYINTTFVYLVAQIVKNLPTVQETQVQSLGWEDPGEGNGNPLQYSCLENPMDRGAWQAPVHGVAKGQTRLCDFT